jgi:2-keto-4-pentenoate hydratase/2-oxohepta-3-ene-1,7-dioic acid hydratase in catechol pathway
MRLAQLRTRAGVQVAALDGDGWRPLLVEPDVDLGDMLRTGCTLDDFAGMLPTGDSAPPVEPQLAPPLRPGKIVAIGLNYLDHIRESGVEPPERPLVFAKFPSAMVADGEPIVLNPAVAQRVDWEVELAVVVGKRLRDVDNTAAMDGVFGYTCSNDVSARDVQFGDGQWTRGKNLDTFCPVGPAIVTADEIPDPQDLRLTTSVNGERVQDASTAEMVFGVAEILSFCSFNFTLEPGDLVLTGTPWGCGEFMTPQRWLRDGDVVEVAVEGIGTLTNPVVTR